MFSIEILARNFRSGEGMGPSRVALSATGGRYLSFGHRIDQSSCSKCVLPPLLRFRDLSKAVQFPMNKIQRQFPSNRHLLHFGCGPFVEKTRWEDLDGSWNARLNHLPAFLRRTVRAAWRITGRQRVLVYPEHVKYLNLNHRLPFPDNSVDAIYASHVWEHLHLNVAKRITLDCARVLKPGGILRVVVPEARVFFDSYLKNNADDAIVRLNEELHYHELARSDSLFQRFYVALTQLHEHKFMYDPKYLTRVFVDAGLVDANPRECFDSGIPEIRDVESASRCSSTAGFAIEGTKPRTGGGIPHAWVVSETGSFVADITKIKTAIGWSSPSA